MATTAQVYQLYLAYFGRPPDFTGLNSFANSTPAQVQAIFSASAESRALLGSTDTATQVNNIYQNLFGRNAETAGLAYWVSEIASGRVTLASAAFDILNGARNADATVVANRIEVAQAFVANYSATTAGILGYVGDAAAAQARTFLRTVTDTTASKTSALAGVAAAVTATVAAGSASGSGGVVGSTFNLTANADNVVGTAADDTINGIDTSTFTNGDQIDGKSGTDTLLLTTTTSGGAAIVALTSVENVNVRLVDNGDLNAIAWDGVQRVTVLNNSIDDLRLDVSGVQTSVAFAVEGEQDLRVDFIGLTSGTETATVNLSAAGTGSGTSAIDAAAVDLDLDDAGLLDAVTISASGANYVNLEGGSDLRTITVTGPGSIVLDTNDVVTLIDASALSSTNRFNVSATSEVTVKGGSGADTVALGDFLSNSDSVIGGAGTDTVTANIGLFGRNLNTSGVEILTIKTTENAAGTLNMSASDVATINASASGATNDLTVSQIAGGVTVNLSDDNLDAVSLDYRASAASTTINVGNTSANFAVASLTISDVASVSLAAVSGSADTNTFALGTVTVDDDVKAVSLRNAGDAVVTVTDLVMGGVTAVTITQSGSGDITFTSGIDNGTALVSVSVTANGGSGADVTLAGIGSIEGSALNFNSVSITADNESDVTFGAVEMGNGVTAAAAGTIILNAGNGSTVGNSTNSNIQVTGQFTLTVDINASASATVLIGDLYANAGDGVATAGGGFTLAAMDVGTGATVQVEQILASASGLQVTIGQINVAKDANVILFHSGLSAAVADVDISSISASIGASGLLQFGSGTVGISISQGTLGSISLEVGDAGSAFIAGISASAMGSITIAASGAGAVDFGAISISGAMGSIEIGGGVTSDVVIGAVSANSIGAIAVSGALDVSIGAIDASGIGTISNVNQSSGAFSINLFAVDTAVEVNLGSATNSVVASDNARGTFTLRSSAGTDTIEFYSAGANPSLLVNFQGGTSVDKVAIRIAELAASGAVSDADGEALTSASIVQFGTASGGAVTLAASASIIFATTAYANTAALVTDLTTNISLSTAESDGSATFVVVWTDGSNTNVSLLSVNGTASGGLTSFASASAVAIADATFATIQGVSAGALVSGNFDFT